VHELLKVTEIQYHVTLNNSFPPKKENNSRPLAATTANARLQMSSTNTGKKKQPAKQVVLFSTKTNTTENKGFTN